MRLYNIIGHNKYFHLVIVMEQLCRVPSSKLRTKLAFKAKHRFLTDGHVCGMMCDDYMVYGTYSTIFTIRPSGLPNVQIQVQLLIVLNVCDCFSSLCFRQLTDDDAHFFQSTYRLSYFIFLSMLSFNLTFHFTSRSLVVQK